MRKKIPFLIVLVFLSLTLHCFADVEKVQSLLIAKNLTAARVECLRLLSGNPDKNTAQLCHFYLATIDLQQNKFLEARRNFNILINDFPQSSLLNRARLGIADSYALEGNYGLADKIYQELLALKVRSIGSIVYARLINLSLMQGDRQKAQEYLNGLHKEYPQSFEASLIPILPEKAPEGLGQSKDDEPAAGSFTVQVGAFSDKAKADKLCRELVGKGEDAYVLFIESQAGQSLYRVRVGRLDTEQEAKVLAGKLSSQGYPTKIFP